MQEAPKRWEIKSGVIKTSYSELEMEEEEVEKERRKEEEKKKEKRRKVVFRVLLQRAPGFSSDQEIVVTYAGEEKF